jgi:negative regulator of flagellin synthesis FlgM
MKIKSPDGMPPNIALETKAVRRNKTGKAVGAARPTPRGDEVSLSDTAKARQVAAAALQSHPEIRSAKVERLKAAIKAGTYEVPGEQIAEKLLDETP